MGLGMGFVKPPKGNDIEIRRGPAVNAKKGFVTIELGKNGSVQSSEGWRGRDRMGDAHQSEFGFTECDVFKVLEKEIISNFGWGERGRGLFVGVNSDRVKSLKITQQLLVKLGSCECFG